MEESKKISSLTIAGGQRRSVGVVGDADRDVSVGRFVLLVTHHHHFPVHRDCQACRVNSTILDLRHRAAGRSWEEQRLGDRGAR